jgi:hypothetical protein
MLKEAYIIPKRGGKHYTLVNGSEQAMEAFKHEVARDLGFNIEKQDDFKKLSTETVGIIGGTMVRRIQAAGELVIMNRYKSGEKRLMPDELLPENDEVRQVTNNGNPADLHLPSSTYDLANNQVH